MFLRSFFFYFPKIPKKKLISDAWIGVPDNIDAAFTSKNNRTYFFKGTGYYLFDDKMFEVFGFPFSGYPFSTGKEWFGCKI